MPIEISCRIIRSCKGKFCIILYKKIISLLIKRRKNCIYVELILEIEKKKKTLLKNNIKVMFLFVIKFVKKM